MTSNYATHKPTSDKPVNKTSTAGYKNSQNEQEPTRAKNKQGSTYGNKSPNDKKGTK